MTYTLVCETLVIVPSGQRHGRLSASDNVMLELSKSLRAAITTYATAAVNAAKSLKAVTQLLYKAGWRVADFDAMMPNGIETLTAALEGKTAPKTVPNPKYTQLWNVVEGRYGPEDQALIQLTGQAVRDLSVLHKKVRAGLRKDIGGTIRNMGTSVNLMAKKEARAEEILAVKKTVKIPAGASGKQVEKLYADAIVAHDAKNAKPVEQGIMIRLAAMQKLITGENTSLLYCKVPATAAAKLAECAKLLDPDGKISLTD